MIFDLIWIIPFVLIYLVIRCFPQNRVPVGRLLLELTFVSYLVLVLQKTQFPLIFMEDPTVPKSYVIGNFIPFETFMSITRNPHLNWNVVLTQVGGNLLLLAPFGFLIPIVWRKANSFKRVAFFSLCFSILIELLQIGGNLITGWAFRVTDVDDVLLNVLGACMGYGLWTLIKWTLNRTIHRKGATI